MFGGYMSNLRLVKGTAVYTSNFTPPTTQLTAITNTSLLTCQSNTIIDNSTNNFTITVYGNSKAVTFSPFTNTYTSLPYSAEVLSGSAYFDGTGDYLTIPYSQSIVQWWDTDYTIEMWVFNTANRQTGGIGIPTQIAYGVPTSDVAYWSFGTNGTGRLYFYYFNGGTVVNAVSPEGVTVPLNTWAHLAMVYNNSTGNLNGYINGKLAFSVAKQGTPQGASGFTLNIGISQGVSYNGYISNLRIVRGTAVYTSDFVPTSSPLAAITNTQLLCNFTNGGILDSSTINDLETVGNTQISTAVKKYGASSIYFDGNGDYLQLLYKKEFSFENDFTIELWCYLISRVTSFPCILNNYSSSGVNGGFAIFAGHGSADTTKFNIAFNGTFPAISSTTSIAYETWQHIALVRSGSTLTLYIDGVANGTSTQTATVSGTLDSLWIGTAGDTLGSSTIYGYISDLRITKGVARYTENFTPPTSPLPKF
jgi:hypothetical protein